MKTTIKILIFILLPFNGYFQDKLNVRLLDQWDDENIPSTSFNVKYNEVYGFVINDREYSVLGSNQGTHIFSLHQNNIEEVAFIPGAAANEFVFHRDYHIYKNYLYAICDEGFSDLQIIDLQYLPDSVNLVYQSKQILSRAHNIFIDTSSALLYACDAVGGTHPNLTGSGIEVIDLSDPINPVPINVNFPGLPDRVHDAYARNDTVFFNCYFDGLQIFTFNNPQSPKKIGHLISYDDQGENHSGWLTDDGNHYLLIDESEGMRIKVVDVSALPTIRVRHLFGTNFENSSIPHNIMIKENFAYVAYYNEGLRIYDISNITNVKEVGYYDTFPIEQNFKMHGAWGIYAHLPSERLLVSDRQSGIFLFKTSVDKALQGTHDFYIFPNPAQNKITINIPQTSLLTFPFILQLSDSKGSVVFSLNSEDQTVFQFDVNHLSEGTYFVSIFNEEELLIASERFVISR